MSDERRRKRYDATGSTSEVLEDDDDFNWIDFFREQTAAMVDGSMIDKIKKEYQGSEEEKDDILRSYEENEGDMDAVYEQIMCSNVLDDDELPAMAPPTSPYNPFRRASGQAQTPEPARASTSVPPGSFPSAEREPRPVAGNSRLVIGIDFGTTYTGERRNDGTFEKRI